MRQLFMEPSPSQLTRIRELGISNVPKTRPGDGMAILLTVSEDVGTECNVLSIELNPTHLTRTRQSRGLNIHWRGSSTLSVTWAGRVVNTTVNTTVESDWSVFILRIRTRAMRNIGLSVLYRNWTSWKQSRLVDSLLTAQVCEP